MKHLLKYYPFLLVLLLMYGCHDFNELPAPPPDDLPETAINFIQNNYDGYVINSVEEEDLCNGTIVIEVELEDGPDPDVDLYFSLDWIFLFSATDISVADLTDAVLSTVETQFPDYTIDEDEIQQYYFPDGSIQFELELVPASGNGSDLELIIAANGEIICQEEDGEDDDDDDGEDDDDDDGEDDDDDDGEDDNDDDGEDDGEDDNDDDGEDDDDDDGEDDDDDDGEDDDDDDNGDLNDIPNNIIDLINSNYPGFQIESFEIEDLCDNSHAYEVELEDGAGPDIDLYFSLDWVFLFATTEVLATALPQAIMMVIDMNYPDYEIGDVERWEMADGSIQYEVELDTDNASDIEIVFGEDGTIICQED